MAKTKTLPVPKALSPNVPAPTTAHVVEKTSPAERLTDELVAAHAALQELDTLLYRLSRGLGPVLADVVQLDLRESESECGRFVLHEALRNITHRVNTANTLLSKMHDELTLPHVE